MYEGYQVPYSRPGTGKVGNPYLQAHASPLVRRHGVRRGNMEPAADPNRRTPSSPGLCHSSIKTPEPSPGSPLIQTSSALYRRNCEVSGLAHTGLDQQRLAQHT
ncbi:hypothetical protein BHE74_00010004 [Ensete ventricosum]|nr:hypothetical protein BHE74_00010004 [Ensete ventricosum]